MKIGINATFLNDKPTGAAIFTKEIAHRISKSQKEMIIFTPVSDDNMPPAHIYDVPEGMKGSVRLSNSLYRFFYINTVLPVLCKLKGVDVLYCPILEFPFIPAVPLVVHIHDLNFIHFRKQFGLAAPRLIFSLKILKKVVRRVVVSSVFVRRELIDAGIFDEEKIDIVPLSFSSSIFNPRPADLRKDFLDKYSIKGRYILFTGSLFCYKNLKTLIDAFLAVRHKIPHFLVVVGRKELSSEPLVTDDRILYMDYVPAEDLPLFYSFADLFVYPSLREGFGIPPLEAMACGTPVISSNRSSLPEVVGDAGIFFDPEDSVMLSELMLKVINNESLRREIIERGFNNVKRYSWDKTASGIIQSCEKALKMKE